MSQIDTKSGQVILNTLTKREFDSASKNATQLYGLKDTHELYLGNKALSRNTAYEAGTNCVTFIPQDIMLELNNGTLTLKAGSKGYMGDGTVRTITGEPALKNSGAAQMFLHITSGGTGLYAGYMTGGTVSERPLSPINNATYYNTSTQKCEYYNGSSWSEVSLPIAIVTRGTDGFVSIDKVFNGFGYIGNLIFVLPGVRGLYPNGRNSDGTLKSTEETVTNLMTGTATYSGSRHLMLNSSTIAGFINVFYDKSRNLLWNQENAMINRVDCGTFTRGAGGSITSFEPKVSFRATDYEDFARLSSSVTSISSSLSSLDSNAMKLTGAQTARGNNTFTGYNLFSGGLDKRLDAILGTTPSSEKSTNIGILDNNGTYLGGLERFYTQDSYHYNRFSVRKQDGSDNYALFDIGYDPNQNQYAYASDGVKNSIASWSTAAISKQQNGYVKLANGIIIQWGRAAVTSHGGQTITLPTAFTDSNYKVISANEVDDGYGQLGITGRTTTNFTFNPNWSGTYGWIAIGY